MHLAAPLYTIRMIWVIKRVLVLWLTLAAICGAVIGIGRLNPAPDVLQTLGFGVCDGEPCYRGVKPGMDWAEAKSLFPQVGIADPTGTYNIGINPSFNGKVVRLIVVESILPHRLPISLGQIIDEYGLPQCLRLLASEGPPHLFFIKYPGLALNVLAAVPTSGIQSDFRLQLESPVMEASITDKNNLVDCSEANPAQFDSWHGFASVEVYYAHFLREPGRP